MAVRLVRGAVKNRVGQIQALCGDGALWSPRSVTDVMNDIESGAFSYYVVWTDGETRIRVVEGPRGKQLRTDKDASARNNLDDLPEC